jgi:hypothetical protein
MGWSDKYKKSIDCNNPKGFSQRAHCQGKKKKMKEESNPRIPRKKGQPANSKKHSDLYTDENPKGTIHGLGFKDVATAKASVTKIKNSSRSHAHKIQAAVAMEQRAREMGKTAEAAVYRKFINSMKEKTKKMNEGTLHKWFKNSKSKDGKPGWVNVVTGGTCASDKKGEGTPKCVSSAKRASMSKAERLSAARRKKKADPGQQQKTGAAKPTYVATDSKKKMKEERVISEGMTSAGFLDAFLPATGDVDLATVNNYASTVGASVSGGYALINANNVGGGTNSSVTSFSFDTSQFSTIKFDVTQLTSGEQAIRAFGTYGSDPNVFYIMSNNLVTDNIINISNYSNRKNFRIQIRSFNSGSGNTHATYRVRASFQRRVPVNLQLSLESPEAINFIRSDPTLVGLSPEERLKKLQEMLDAGDEYLLKALGIIGGGARPGSGDIAQGLPYTDYDDAFDDPYYQGPPPDIDDDSDFEDPFPDLDLAKGNGTEIAGFGLRPDGTQGFSEVGDVVPDHNGNPMKLVPDPQRGRGMNRWVPVKKASAGDEKKGKKKKQPVVAHHEPKGEVIAEKSALKSIPGYYDGKPSILGFPDNPPPEMIKGYHPDLVTPEGQKKQSDRYNRLDPQSAKAMPKTGNPFIDAKVKAAVKSANSKKKMKKEEVQVTEGKDKKGKGSGTKDACYHKVKSRYRVWPSAYASGALVKCRKVGAANWGNKSEEVDIQEKKKGGAKKCWPGYKKVGTQKLFGKTYNRCVKAGYEMDGITFREFKGLCEGAAWTKKAGKNPEGGLNEKGRKSYERENPGSDLKAPSKKVGNKRRASFCARMKGMKAKLTSAKTARDPDSRINKSLRAWNC